MTDEPPLKNDQPPPQGWSRAELLRLLLPAAVVITGAVFALSRSGGTADPGDERPASDVALAGAELVGGGGEIQPSERVGRINAARPDVIVELNDAEPPAVPSTPPAPAELAGATRIGGGGTVHPNVAPISTLEGTSVNDLDLFEATSVRPDADGGLWILVLGEPGTGRRPLAHGGRGTVMRVLGDRVEYAREIPAAAQAWLLTAGPGSDVEVAMRESPRGNLTVLGRDSTGLDDRTLEGLMENLRGTVGGGGRLGPVAITEDGAIVAAHRNRSRIDAIAPNDDVRHMLGEKDQDRGVEVALDRSLGEITSLVALPDDRLAFTRARGPGGIDPDDRYGMHLLESGKIRRITPRLEDPDRRIVGLLGLTPEGQLLALAAGSETHPQILVIDADTDDVDVVADLVDVMPHPEGPRGVPGALWGLSATADGRDLVFLADGLLWRLPDAFGAEPSVKK